MRASIGLLILILCAFPSKGQETKLDAAGVSQWKLGLSTSDADISPDDRFLAVTLETEIPIRRNNHAFATEFVQVWDYKKKLQIRSIELATYPKIAPTPNVVRFVADGTLLLVSDPIKLYVLDSATLRPLRVIEPPLDQDFRIFHIEAAPIGHIAIVTANRYPAGTFFAYDLDTGQLLFKSTLSESVSSIAWNPDGTQFAIAMASSCRSSRDTLHIFGTNPWSHLRSLSVRDSASLAFSKDRLFVAQSGSCKGSIFNRHLGLESFDTKEWRRQETLRLHSDIHDSVSFAGNILLADTGEVELTHDWLDATTWGEAVTRQFTAWKGDATAIVFTSPSLPVEYKRIPGSCPLRLSRSGKMVLLCPRDPQLFEIPTN